MRKIFILVLMIIAGISSTKAQTFAEIKKLYPKMFTCEVYDYEGEKYASVSLVESIESGSYTKYFNDNKQYIDYLFNHSLLNSFESLSNESDSVIRHKKAIEIIEKDSGFNKLMEEFVSRPMKDTFSIDDAAQVASKFFFVPQIVEGNYAGKVCVGINGIESTEADRRFQLEAFCFALIINSYGKEGKFDAYEELVSSLKQLYEINFGIDEKERLLRAQGAMYMLMYKNEKLRTALKNEYEAKKDILPFVMVD